ncbi:MAG: glycosyltransferase [Eubacteriales bacterium]
MKYFGYYADSRRLDKANCTLAAVNKMDYIADVIANVAGSAEIISFSSKLDGSQKSECIQLRDGVSVKYFHLKSHKKRVVRVVSRFFDKLKLLLWIFKNVCKDETVIVYHSLGYLNQINFAHKVKKFKLIFEVEEIFADVIGNERLRKKEVKRLKSADAYIFPTRLLDDCINTDGKPSVIIHGTYQVEPDRKCRTFSDNLHEEKADIVHVVYAGTLDPRKGGAVAAAAAAHLPENYHIHILGFGSEQDVQEMKDLVARIAFQAKARVTYDGLLSGEEYIRFIQSCDIGLSTQNPDAAFNATSFPSKILSYMANGLRVVSIRISAIETSAIGEYMYYYDEQTPEKIADAIKSVNINDEYNGRKVISELDQKFQKELNCLLEV